MIIKEVLLVLLSWNNNAETIIFALIE